MIAVEQAERRLRPVSYSKSCQTSKMELLEKMANNVWPLTIFLKRSILDILQGSECTTEDRCLKSIKEIRHFCYS